MFHEFAHLLLPSQTPDHWRPGDPIDLLPALRARHPGCIDDSLLALQLHWPPHADRWLLWQMRAGEPLCESSIGPLTEDDGDGYDYGDFPRDEYPAPILEDLLSDSRVQRWQTLAHLFKDDAFQMMERLRQHAQDECGDSAFQRERRDEAQIRTLWALARRLARHATTDLALAPAAVARLRAEPAFGMRDGAHLTRWDEVMDEACSPSLLFERTRRDVSSAVWDSFHALPYVQQLALWVQTYSDPPPVEDLPSVDGTPDDGHLNDGDLTDLRAHIDDLTSNVMRQAGDEGWRREAEQDSDTPDLDA
jgi:hypothetical protein